jgi:predicted tellurium resistance membrane protein TerC
MEGIADPQASIALVTLTFLEIVLGTDNSIFISILAGKLPQEQQGRARQVGLALAMITRIRLLLSLNWIARLTEPLFAVFHVEISGRTLILLGGGLFLLAKSTYEIHERREGETAYASAKVKDAAAPQWLRGGPGCSTCEQLAKESANLPTEQRAAGTLALPEESDLFPHQSGV